MAMNSRSGPAKRTWLGEAESGLPAATGDHHDQVEVVQLAGASEQPQSGTNANTKDPHHSFVDFEQILRESALIPETSNYENADAILLETDNLPSLQFEEETLRCGSDDMSAHVPLQICQKIWQNQYINIALLLKGNVELHELCSGGLIHITESGTIETRPKITKDKVSTIEKWTDAFMIFISIYLKKHPSKAHELLQYMSIIREAATRNVGLSWRTYEEQFRLRQAKNLQSWAKINSDLWLRVLSMGNSVANVPPKSKPNTSTCNYFNQGYCSYKPCRFPHVCSHCGGSNHGRINCFQLKDQVTGSSNVSTFRRFRGTRPFNRGSRNYANRGNRQ